MKDYAVIDCNGETAVDRLNRNQALVCASARACTVRSCVYYVVRRARGKRDALVCAYDCDTGALRATRF